MKNNDLRMPPVFDAIARALTQDWQDECRADEAKRKELGVPDHVPIFVNKCPAADKTAFAALPTGETDNAWDALRHLVLAARSESDQVTSYRSKLASILKVLVSPIHGTGRVKLGHSLVEIQEYLCSTDVEALVWAIWKQDPQAVQRVPAKTIYQDQKKPPHETKDEVQVFLHDERPPDVTPMTEVGLAFSDEKRWHIKHVVRDAYRLHAGWRKLPAA